MNDLRTAAQQALDSINELFTAEQSEGGERSGHIRTPATREHLVRIAQARKALHESCGALRTALAQQAEPVKQVKTCAWRANLDAIYETECGNLHIVNDGTLEENGMKYCCYCGKEIEDESPT